MTVASPSTPSLTPTPTTPKTTPAAVTDVADSGGLSAAECREIGEALQQLRLSTPTSNGCASPEEFLSFLPSKLAIHRKVETTEFRPLADRFRFHYTITIS